MWDIFKDYMNSFLGIIFLGVPLMGTLWYQRKSETERKKKRKLFTWICVIFFGCLILAGLGVDKINRDNAKDRLNTSETKKRNSIIDSLSNNVSLLVSARKIDSLKSTNDSIRDVEFQNQLFKEFKITRDSITNKPTIINKITNIDKVHTANFY